MGGDPRRHHRTPPDRGTHHPPRPLRCADRPAEPRAVPRTAQAANCPTSRRTGSSPCSTSTSTSSRASTTRSGHMVGDELLKSVATSLAACVRDTDFVARLGGDEFAIVQTAVKRAADVTDLVNRIHEAIRTPYRMPRPSGDHRRQHRHRAGAAGRFRSRRDPQERGSRDVCGQGRRPPHLPLLRAGDGRPGPARRILEMDLRQAHRRGRRLEVYYQPCLDLQDNRITGCEALVRWRHPAARHDLAGRIHPDRRRDRPDQPARRMGADHRLQRGRDLARRYPASRSTSRRSSSRAARWR